MSVTATKSGFTFSVMAQLAELEESNEGVDRIVRMTASPKLFHKSRTPKVMFLAVTARPRIEYRFDGKIGLWPFTVAHKAQRSDVCIRNGCWRNGDHGECYRGCARISLRYAEEGGVFDAMRTKMWWFKRGSSRPDAGSTLYYLHDEVKAHTAKIKQQHWSQHRRKQDF